MKQIYIRFLYVQKEVSQIENEFTFRFFVDKIENFINLKFQAHGKHESEGIGEVRDYFFEASVSPSIPKCQRRSQQNTD